MLKKSLIVVGGICVILAGFNAISPHDFKFEREITINQSKSFVFNYLKFLKNGQSWSPFLAKDPTVIIEVKGIDGMPGSILHWTGNSDVGTADQKLKSLIEGEKIELETNFLIPFKATHQAFLHTEEAGKNQTRVKWGLSGSVPFPINIIAKFKGMNQSIPIDMDAGLTKLKTQLESMIAIPDFKL